MGDTIGFVGVNAAHDILDRTAAMTVEVKKYFMMMSQIAITKEVKTNG